MHTDVLIVGAGCAGLMAAVRIQEAGRQVLVLEARDLPGGRVRTLHDVGAPMPVELGAEFVHGVAPLSRALLEGAGALTVGTHGETWRGREGQLEAGDEAWRGIGLVLGALRADRTPDRSFADFLRAEGHRFPASAVEAARAFVEGFYAADPERISERSLAEEGTQGAASSDRVPAGYDVLVRHLVGRLSAGTLLERRLVKRVAWRAGRVDVEATRGRSGSGSETLSARAVVVTVPLGVLKAPRSSAGIAFDPEIPTLPRILASLEVGSAVRLTLVFSRPLWEPPPLVPTADGRVGPPSFVHTPARAFNAFWTVEPSRTAALVAWSGGARSAELAADVDVLTRCALHDMASATGAGERALTEALTGAWTHDWRSDPFSLGAYAYIGVGGSGAPDQMSRPVDHTVFFAGEATCAESIGTVEGALASGDRAARNVLLALK